MFSKGRFIILLACIVIGQSIDSENEPPSLEYEVLRRRIEENINELWKNARSGARDRQLTKVLAENKNSLLSDMDKLRQNDGHDEWRKREILALEDIVQARLHRLQNPNNCAAARKVVCNLAQTCGLGCKSQHMVRCQLIAYATNRTLVLEEERRNLYGDNTWDDVFQPVSETCTLNTGSSHGDWKDHYDAADPIQVIHVPKSKDIKIFPGYFIPAIPDDLASRLIKVSGDPAAWWISQFAKFVLRFTPLVQQMVENRATFLNISSGPIVGVHIRRTDKLESEAEYYALDEYMEAVSNYYDRLETARPEAKIIRRVFIATDDPTAIEEAKLNYPKYEIVGDKSIAKSAARMGRYSLTGLTGVILDTYVLSLCDFVVCTFSSNVCRLAYELKLSRQPLSTDHFLSLDSAFHLWKSNTKYYEATLPGKDEQGFRNLKVGDLVKVRVSSFKGWSQVTKTGFNERTRHMDSFPNFKLAVQVPSTQMPNY